MEEMISKLTEKVGIDRATAEKVVEFVKEHMDEIPGWIAKSGLTEKLPEGVQSALGGFLGGGSAGE
ncbi:MAG: hypothetical protein BGO01_00650 [Armatimonadetes bacterium 55-13]|nr:MAG: hypothetical protein BGO01_00650 [Armatimonadetes bacterium 55-13]